VKTSKFDAPSDEEELTSKYLKYYYQVQFQMWVSGFRNAFILWCLCSEGEDFNGQPLMPYDEEGRLSITAIPIGWDPDIGDIFEAECPRFWKQWIKARNEFTEQNKQRAANVQDDNVL
jgi:hypothetical protein